MAINLDRAGRHVADWAAALASSRAPYRRLWPKFLFRHEEISNAALVLRRGALLSRNDATGFVDVAAGDILAQSNRAHSYARLYFRPKSPTQYRIEGVRRPSEIWHGAHAPVLVMFAFDAQGVLTSPGTKFSDGNMQSPGSSLGEDQDFFDGISFSDVYHVGAFTVDEKERIVRARCAEVLAESPLELDVNLKAVICRSPAERAYLIDSIGPQLAQSYARRIISHSEPGIFESTWAYVDTVDSSREGFRVKFHPRLDGTPCSIGVRVSQNGAIVWQGAIPSADLSLVWRVPYPMGPGTYRCDIEIDSCLAYSATHLIDDLPY